MNIGDSFRPYRLFQGAMIPNWLLVRKDVSNGAKLIYARMGQYHGKDGTCHPKQDTLAAEVGLSERQTRDYVSELVSHGLIRATRRGLGLSNSYEFVWHQWIEEDQPHSGDNPPLRAASSSLSDRQTPAVPLDKENQSKRIIEEDQIAGSSETSADKPVTSEAKTSSDGTRQKKTGSRKKSTPTHPPEEIARAQEFLALWIPAFLKACGTPYKPDGRDMKQLYAFLGDHPEPVAELITLAGRAWADDYKASQAGRICDFTWNYYKLVMGLRDRVPLRSGPKHIPESNQIQERIESKIVTFQ